MSEENPILSREELEKILKGEGLHLKGNVAFVPLEEKISSIFKEAMIIRDIMRKEQNLPEEITHFNDVTMRSAEEVIRFCQICEDRPINLEVVNEIHHYD